MKQSKTLMQRWTRISEEELPSALRGSNADMLAIMGASRHIYRHPRTLYVANGELVTLVAGKERRTKTEYYMPADTPRTLESKMGLWTEFHDARRSPCLDPKLGEPTWNSSRHIVL
jgi:hypothetical protein